MALTILSRRTWLQLAATGSLSLALAACGAGATTSASTNAAPAAPAVAAPTATSAPVSPTNRAGSDNMPAAAGSAAGSMDTLIAAAKQEGL